MRQNGRHTPNANTPVIRMLCAAVSKSSRGRNRILLGAVILGIVTLCMVFGVSFGKIQAEYLRSIRQSGTAASTYLEDGTKAQYNKIKSLSYIREVGRSWTPGYAYKEAGGESLCEITVLDKTAWDVMERPAYTGIEGHYPQKAQELMLPVRALEDLGIRTPEKGMKLHFIIEIGLFRTEEETFTLCGWYEDYAEPASNMAKGYISEEKLKEWGGSMEKPDHLLIRQKDSMDGRRTEEKLYDDIRMADTSQTFTGGNTYAYDAVNRFMGGYGMAAFGAVLVLASIFFLIHNVMHISMAKDIRQIGLLNTIGTTAKQIRGIYFRQILRILAVGIPAGVLIAALLLSAVVPQLLGRQYLARYGGAAGLDVLRPQMLALAAVFTGIVTAAAAGETIYRAVSRSCIEAANYNGIEQPKTKRRVKKAAVLRRRTPKRELWYMAWQNLCRFRGRSLRTVLSLFLGLEVALSAVVIASGADQSHAIEARPDILVAGEFSSWGKAEGYGEEYKGRDPQDDPLETEGGNLALTSDNDYDSFSPVGEEVKEELLAVDGVKKEESYAAEGGYMCPLYTRKGVRPMVADKESETDENYTANLDTVIQLIEAGESGTIQILGRKEIEELKEFAEKSGSPADMESLENGTGVLLLHDHILSPAKEKQAEESVGEPILFSRLWSKKERDRRLNATAQEREKMGDIETEKSEKMTLCGYMDTKAEGFPALRRTWHGPRIDYFVISEEGFKKLGTAKKTFYMELNVEKGKELSAEKAVRRILTRENGRRGDEAGLFLISKAGLLQEAQSYIRGSRLILGILSMVLIAAGLMNYLNMMVTGLWSRQREFALMEGVGMTRRQLCGMLVIEGLYYCLLTAGLMLTAGSGILFLVHLYMKAKLAYFTFTCPWAVFGVMILVLACICVCVPLAVSRKTGRTGLAKRLAQSN